MTNSFPIWRRKGFLLRHIGEMSIHITASLYQRIINRFFLAQGIAPRYRSLCFIFDLEKVVNRRDCIPPILDYLPDSARLAFNGEQRIQIERGSL